MIQPAAGVVAGLLALQGAGPRASVGCTSLAAQTATGTLINQTLGDRRYLQFVPAGYAAGVPAPVILSYHGGNRTADEQLALDGLTDPYFNTEYMVLYPYGIDGVPNFTVDDVAFTQAMLDEVERTYCVDRARVFATGKSDGGGMAGVLACDAAASARIAAFAPVSGAFYVDTRKCGHPDTVAIPCKASRADVPVLEFHGGADDTINYDGGLRKKACLPSIPNWITAWAVRDGLGATNRSVRLTHAATTYIFGRGATKGLVTHVYDGDNVGHDWPSTAPNDDNTRANHAPASFNATTIILDFFAAHPLTTL